MLKPVLEALGFTILPDDPLRKETGAPGFPFLFLNPPLKASRLCQAWPPRLARGESGVSPARVSRTAVSDGPGTILAHSSSSLNRVNTLRTWTGLFHFSSLKAEPSRDSI